ncbi:MAG: hypothetical protein ACJ8FS_15045 [Sphingomicrobium sp.]
MAWLALGGGSASTLAALLIGLNLKGKDDGDHGNDASDGDA